MCIFCIFCIFLPDYIIYKLLSFLTGFYISDNDEDMPEDPTATANDEQLPDSPVQQPEIGQPSSPVQQPEIRQLSAFDFHGCMRLLGGNPKRWPMTPKKLQQTNRQDWVFIRPPGISEGAFL
jgi:hypothetical protein